jgi:adenosylcobinamide-phosphate synthase
MNYVPARATWLLLALVAVGIPGCSARKALGVGFRQHGALPSPNSGWSEAAIAGALQRRLVGPIWANGKLVTDRWIGVPSDPPLEQGEDYDRAAMLVTVSGLTASAFACALALRMG